MLSAPAKFLAGAGALLAAIAVASAGAATSPAPAPSLKGKIVHIDAGHNGGNSSHPDAVNKIVNAGGGVRKACDTSGTETNDGKLAEATYTLDVAMRLRALLQGQGAKVVMTRKTNTGVGPCITRRAAIGNEAHANAAISIHADGGPAGGRGFHVIAPLRVSGQSSSMVAKSDLLARRVRTALKAKGYRTATYIAVDGLDHRNDLGGLNLSRIPKVFVELGNMRNAADAKLLENATQRQRQAQALAAALSVQLTH
jgi:N-acetylmuramoyl-L-alanine amidase